MSNIPFDKNIVVNYVPDIREKIKEIIFNWGQMKPWQENRARQAALMIGYIDRYLLVGTDSWDFIADMFSKVDMNSKSSMLQYDSAEYKNDLCGPSGEMGVADIQDITDETSDMIHFLGELYKSEDKHRIFKVDEELKNGEL